jgi:hypothetical protein
LLLCFVSFFPPGGSRLFSLSIGLLQSQVV